MKPLRTLSALIDRLTSGLGRLVYWLTLALILFGAFNAVARYLGKYIGVDLSSNAYIEAQWYLFSAVFLLGSGYTLLRNEHVRVDAVYGRLSTRSKAWINLLGTSLFLIPFCIFMLYVCTPAVINSWHVHEISSDPGGLPRYPIKTLVPIAFLLLMLQAISELIKQIDILFGAGPADADEAAS